MSLLLNASAAVRFLLLCGFAAVLLLLLFFFAGVLLSWCVFFADVFAGVCVFCWCMVFAAMRFSLIHVIFGALFLRPGPPCRCATSRVGHRRIHLQNI